MPYQFIYLTDKTVIITLLVLIGWGFTDLRMPIDIGGGNTFNLGSLIGIILIVIALAILNYYYGPFKRIETSHGNEKGS